ncbi:uncharacterized protein LOC128551609 [Mercenaria mercenaria]|uniref:uncharacterized protein LOC128551609 n=1 Tax=Mercenaria mercenaria TaxID=6596 RepID=UPI00234EC9CD|nr:uncharacterized protein LOC128551609 [Mercenaria mercenaria]
MGIGSSTGKQFIGVCENYGQRQRGDGQSQTELKHEDRTSVSKSSGEKTLVPENEEDFYIESSSSRNQQPVHSSEIQTGIASASLSAATKSQECEPSRDQELSLQDEIERNENSGADSETTSNKHIQQWKIDPIVWSHYLDNDDEDEAMSLLQKWTLPDNDVLNKICQAKARNSNVVKMICRNICDFIKQKSTMIRHVWSAFRPDGNEDIIFVMLTSHPVEIESAFQTYQRCEDEISDESQNENEHIYHMQQQDGLDSEEMDKLTTYVKQNAKKLMQQHSNLTKISASWVKSSGYNTLDACIKKIPCIALYVHIKGLVPINEEPFQKTIVEYPFDVREGVFTLCGKPSDFHRNVKMGCEIDSGYGTQQGTIGPFFEFQENSEIYYLTSAHVLLDTRQMELLTKRQDGCIFYGISGSDTFQPPETKTVKEESKRYYLGKIELAVYKEGDDNAAGMELALVRLSKDRVPVDGSFPEISNMSEFGQGYPFHYSSGKYVGMKKLTHTTDVYKYGCTSGLTKGRCFVHGSSVRTNKLQERGYGIDITLYNQIEIASITPKQPFAVQGDSGAVVLVRDGNDLAAVGLFEGRMEHYFVVTPIEDIVRELSENLSRYKGVRSEEEMEFEEYSRFKAIKLYFVPQNPESTVNETVRDEVSRQTSSMQTNIIHHAEHSLGTVKEELTAMKADIANSNAEMMRYLKAQFKEMKDLIEKK